MRNLVLKMVHEGVVSSDNANKILSMKKGTDSLYRALSRGMIDEKKLAKFYEKEGYPVIYDEGRGPMADEFFTRFFTPDVIARHLVVPISFKKENKDIIVGFINSALIPNVKETIKCIFPEFNTTFFHIPYSIFKKIVAKHFLFDIEKYIAIMTQKEISGDMHTDKGATINAAKKKLSGTAEQIFLLELEDDGSFVFREQGLASRFPLKSLPLFQEGFKRGYINMIISTDDNKKSFFMLVNPKQSRADIESLIS